ncbi:hypothetical protein SLNWT_5482 [Streptomyces albus]|uniref:Uncharacterized protein n=1 Tax=Streptomyces albus (strain ATCC 21838 / DSM 41398 / FERM P-419 / JCM 4703 / NBRC 107858) TaxID=1081613 RepID=A0A0B5ESV2_STRA4|nr:hypothetical protein SLNWT_5482 [Streptomyces albus]
MGWRFLWGEVRWGGAGEWRGLRVGWGVGGGSGGGGRRQVTDDG